MYLISGWMSSFFFFVYPGLDRSFMHWLNSTVDTSTPFHTTGYPRQVYWWIDVLLPPGVPLDYFFVLPAGSDQDNGTGWRESRRRPAPPAEPVAQQQAGGARQRSAQHDVGTQSDSQTGQFFHHVAESKFQMCASSQGERFLIERSWKLGTFSRVESKRGESSERTTRTHRCGVDTDHTTKAALERERESEAVTLPAPPINWTVPEGFSAGW